MLYLRYTSTVKLWQQKNVKFYLIVHFISVLQLNITLCKFIHTWNIVQCTKFSFKHFESCTFKFIPSVKLCLIIVIVAHSFHKFTNYLWNGFKTARNIVVLISSPNQPSFTTSRLDWAFIIYSWVVCVISRVCGGGGGFSIS